MIMLLHFFPGRYFLCALPECELLCWICRSGDRGHRYCSKEHSRIARRRSTRKAGRRFAATAAGRAGKRRRQQDYRQRARSGVAHHGSSTRRHGGEQGATGRRPDPRPGGQTPLTTQETTGARDPQPSSPPPGHPDLPEVLPCVHCGEPNCSWSVVLPPA